MVCNWMKRRLNQIGTARYHMRAQMFLVEGVRLSRLRQEVLAADIGIPETYILQSKDVVQ